MEPNLFFRVALSFWGININSLLLFLDKNKLDGIVFQAARRGVPPYSSLKHTS